MKYVIELLILILFCIILYLYFIYVIRSSNDTKLNGYGLPKPKLNYIVHIEWYVDNTKPIHYSKLGVLSTNKTEPNMDEFKSHSKNLSDCKIIEKGETPPEHSYFRFTHPDGTKKLLYECINDVITYKNNILYCSRHE